MSKVKIQGNASGSGVFTLTTPSTSTDRTITLPDGTGTLAFTTGDDDKLPLSGGTLTGVLNANAGINIDNFNIDGTTIALSSGNMHLDAGNEIWLDSNDGNVRIKKAGTDIGMIQTVNNDLIFRSMAADKDIVFKGDDGGSAITALTLDMSSQGDASFNRHIKLSDSGQLVLGGGSDLLIYHDGNNSYVKDDGDGDLYLMGSAEVLIRSAANANMIKCVTGAQVNLYYDNGVKIATTSEGAQVTGHLRLNNSQQIQFGGSATHIDGDSGYMAFDTNSAERMRIDSSGRLGIGRTPAALLHLQATVPEIRFTYTGNSGYSYIKGDANNALKFSTGTTSGTERMELSGAGVLNQFSGTAIQNGLSLYRNTGSVNSSTVVVNVDHTIGNGGGGVALVEAAYSHHAMSSYGAAYMAYIAFYNGSIVSETTILDLTSGNGGNWVCTTTTAGTLRVTKNAGSYAGGGEWFVKVTSQVR